MPASIDDTLNAADKEWNHWGKSTWNLISGKKKIVHIDNDDTFAKYVQEQYCKPLGATPSLADIQNDEYAWSAVGMSAFMRNAGFTKQEFPFSESHSVFIRHFIKARKDKDKSAAFWGYRLGESGGVPAVGDLVAYARGKNMTPEKAKKFFDKTDAYMSHTDIVVAVRPGEIDVIGANVLDSVTLKTVPTNSTGHINDSVHHWFAVLKRR